MKTKLSEIEKVLRDLKAQREKSNNEFSRLESQKSDFSEKYFSENIQPQINQSKNYLTQFEESKWEKFLTLAHEYLTMASEKHNSPVDLNSTKLLNAVNIIQSSAGNLEDGGIDANMIRQINEQFRGDFPSLKVLRATYKKMNMYDGAIDQMFYDTDNAEESTQDLSRYVFAQGGNVNNLCHMFSKIAKIDGLEFPETIDEKEFDTVTRKAAGL